MAATEFALLAPLLILLVLGTTDLTNYLRIRLQVDETAAGVANLVTQYSQLYASDFTDIFNAAQLIAGSVAVTGSKGTTIVTCVVNSGAGPTIAWQQKSPGATYGSRFGAVGAAPTLPDGYVVGSGESLIATEVASATTPWVWSARLLGTGMAVMRSYALFQPRGALLSQITSGTRP